MPTFDFKCNKCDFKDEFNTTIPSMAPPDVCPKCSKGKLEKQFTTKGQSFEVIGGFEYQYGKKARYFKDPLFRAKAINGEVDPY